MRAPKSVSLSLLTVTISIALIAATGWTHPLSKHDPSFENTGDQAVLIQYRPPVKPIKPVFNEAAKPKLKPRFNKAAGSSGRKAGGGSKPPKLSGPKGPKFKPPGI